MAGCRLYSDADESRIRRMQAHLAAGLSAAETVRAALSEERGRPPQGRTESAEGGGAAGPADRLDRLNDAGGPGRRSTGCDVIGRGLHHPGARRRASLPAWLWLKGQRASGTFALLITPSRWGC